MPAARHASHPRLRAAAPFPVSGISSHAHPQDSQQARPGGPAARLVFSGAMHCYRANKHSSHMMPLRLACTPDPRRRTASQALLRMRMRGGVLKPEHQAEEGMHCRQRARAWPRWDADRSAAADSVCGQTLVLKHASHVVRSPA